MDKAKVIRILKSFPEIDEEIRTIKNAIADLEQCYNPISAIQYDNMPKRSYHAKSQTEKMAINIPNYISKEINIYKQKIETLQKVKVEIIREVSRLNLKHKKIIFGFYFQGMKWEEVAECTNYSDRQCKNIRDEALEKLLKGFQKNEVLSQFDQC
jgi:hypothetical protein